MDAFAVFQPITVHNRIDDDDDDSDGEGSLTASVTTMSDTSNRKSDDDNTPERNHQMERPITHSSVRSYDSSLVTHLKEPQDH